MFVELHMIQNFAPSNLNRDDNNAPKDCEFGGVRRARISSQAIKRAIRTGFQRGLLPEADQALRTKRLMEEITKRLAAGGRNREEAATVARIALNSLLTTVGKDDKTKYLLFLGNREIDGLTAICDQQWDLFLGMAEAATAEENAPKSGKATKKAARAALPPELKEALNSCLGGGKAVDLALFGRMIADLPERNIDAACQVAHAISTHQVSAPEFDFYTAVDDLKRDDTAGADMMGTIQFNSACFYRYANLDVTQLLENLDGDAAAVKDAVEAFIRAAIAAIPTGKQNSMAAQNPPSLVFAVVRDGGLWSLANAFVRPVRPSQTGDLVENSVQALDRFWARMVQMYGAQSIRQAAGATLEETELRALSGYQVQSVDQVVTAVNEAVAAGLREVAGGR